MNVTRKDKETLQLFCKRADDIENSSIFKENKYQVSTNISGKAGEPIKISETAPEKEALVALITILRQFYARNERINFDKVFALVSQIIIDKDKRIIECANSAQTAFHKIKNETTMGIMIDGKKLTAIGIIDLWFNGNIFHADLKKVKKFESLMNSPVAPFISFEFKSTMINLSNVLIYFGNFIEAEVLPELE